MKTYKVSIIETLQMEVAVEAENAAAAKELVEGEWKDGTYILDADNFKQVNFVSRSAERSRSYGR